MDTEKADGYKTHILLLAVDVDEVGRTPMAPPQLTRDTPILDTLQPAVPLVLRRLGLDLELARTRALSPSLVSDTSQLS